MDRYVIELGRGYSYSIRRYLARASGRKPYEVKHRDVIQEFLIPILEQIEDNLRTVSNSRSDWSFHIYHVRKTRNGYRLA